MEASIALEDGTYLQGFVHGVPQNIFAEFVFNTAMTGYEEVLSDPSYRGQAVVFTSSHIGNTGITTTDLQSHTMEAEAILCKNLSTHFDNHRGQISLEDYLHQQNRMAVSQIDTRMLTSRIRNKGCLRGLISSPAQNLADATARLSAHLNATQPQPLACSTIQHTPLWEVKKHRYKLAIMDFGIKKGILQCLESLGCHCTRFSPATPVQDIEAISPDGLFFSNGPGDPRLIAAQFNLSEKIHALAMRYPSFGICLGHQLLGLAFGGTVSKMGFGHHAINHPVHGVGIDGERLATWITSQNHNYCVDLNSICKEFKATHLHSNDGTLAGMRHHKHPIVSVQFHPEAAPGPHDAAVLFTDFIKLMENNHGKKVRY